MVSKLCVLVSPVCRVWTTRSQWWGGVCPPVASSTGSDATPGVPTGEKMAGSRLSGEQTTSGLSPPVTGLSLRQLPSGSDQELS